MRAPDGLQGEGDAFADAVGAQGPATVQQGVGMGAQARQQRVVDMSAWRARDHRRMVRWTRRLLAPIGVVGVPSDRAGRADSL